MIYRPFGKTGKDVSLIGFGTVRFSAGAELFSSNVDLVLKALELGVNYFDTADTYVSGLSDKILSEAFKNAGDSKYYISTKSMISRDPTVSDVLKRVESSIETLNIDKITFFHMWAVKNIKQYKAIIASGGPYEGALRAKEQGLIEHICISVHCSGNELQQILDDALFDGITVGFNATNYKLYYDGLVKAFNMGLGTAIMNPLAGGLIPSNPEYFSYLQHDSLSTAESALQFVSSHKEVSTMLLGVNSLRDLNEAVTAIENDSPLSSSGWLDKISSAPKMDNPLCTLCNYCNGCPAGLRVDQIMGLYNDFLLSGKSKAKLHSRKDIYLGLSPIESIPCTKCGLCETKCTQHLPIIKRIEEMNTLANIEMEKQKELINKHFPDDGYLKTGIYGLSIEADAMLRAYMFIYGKLPENVEFFDTKPAKWGTSVMDTEHKIHQPSMIREMGIRRILITAVKYADEIIEYLKDYTDDSIRIDKL